jgi:23S rRNA pseudouridine1911/1915/1917 synthase
MTCRAGFSRPRAEHSPVDQADFIIADTDHNARLDIYLAARMPALSRSRIQKLIGQSYVTVNGVAAKAGHKVQPGENVSVTVPPPEPSDIVPEDIPLEVVYEDDQIIVINKPKGMTVHPAPGNRTGTLVNAVVAYTDDLSGIGGVERPGIVHRLDKDTSGLLVVAKTDAAHASLQAQIQARTAERRYMALVWGETKFNEAVVDAPIGRHPTDRQKQAVIKDTGRYTARDAVTHLKVTERFEGFTLLEAKLDTGRTHQIRVHCSFIGHPVVGDPVYGGTKRPYPPFPPLPRGGRGGGKLDQRDLTRLIDDLHGQALHAFSLSFDHPTSGERLSFEAPLPPDIVALLEWLRGEMGITNYE